MSELTQGGNSPSRTIYINPHFKKQMNSQQQTISSGAHINPLFLGAHRAPAIHMNPNFLQSKLLNRQKLQENSEHINSDEKLASEYITKAKSVQPQHLQLDTIDLTIDRNPVRSFEESIVNKKLHELPSNECTTQKIISKSRTKIVREPAVVHKPVSATPSPLLRLSSRKLVRRTLVPPAINISPGIAPASSISTIGKYKLVRWGGIPGNVNKNKVISQGVKFKRKTFVARYALQRSNSDSKFSSTSSKLRSLPVNKKLQLLNINGVLYRSTRNKLQRKDASLTPKPLGPAGMSAQNIKSNFFKSAPQKPGKSSFGRVLFVHGTKFVLDKSGFKLTRITPGCEESMSDLQKSGTTAMRPRQRIDIGGLTYVASTTQNVFVRTRNHLALAHLNTAKNRSLQLLTRRLVKSNIPCAIFQRIGKCIAHERGKCNKVHDKLQITICPRFLRSDCHNSACLLSHNVSLAKMPVCKFFLQGVCVRTDCPYLHKKLSVNADVCPDFLRGYCKLAEQCNKRHEFVCPEFERKGNCELANCIYCKNRKRKLTNEQPSGITKALETSTRKEHPKLGSLENSAVSLRYFIDKDTNAQTSDEFPIDKVDVMKEAFVESVHNLDNDMPSLSGRPKVGALPAYIPLL